ncbi:MAG: M60 family peptidase N-terminal accessory domain-containing protein, partial [Bacteroidota bacterium]
MYKLRFSSKSALPSNFVISMLCLWGLGIFSSNAQLASYNYNANAEDQISSYNPQTIVGTPDYSSGEYVALDSGEYFLLPNSLNTAFDNSESLEIHVRFKVIGDWEATTPFNGSGEEARIILSTKPEYDQRFEGFNVAAREWESDLWILTTFGDGILDENGIQSEGKLDFVARIEPDVWYDFTIKFVFNEDNPYIQYIVNGTSSLSYYDERVDYEGFRQTVTAQQISVGSTENNAVNTQFPSMDLQIDSLVLWSPAQPGNPVNVESSLQAFIDHMNGDAVLTTDQLDSVKSVFLDNWDDASYDAARTVVDEYMSTYSDVNGFVFTLKYNAEFPDTFDQLKSIQFQIQQWVLDNKYTAASMNDMEGLTFKEHENFPGTVSASAARLQDATFTVDGDYQTDPGFFLNDQEYVRRPSGYYVAPGELVTLTVPDQAIGEGLTVYVGAHRKNLQETWTELRRYPRISTDLPIDSKTITITNPFGGGLYIAIPDGTQLGSLTFEIDGALKAPYYSTKSGFSTDLTEFMQEIQKKEVPWADMESSNFMTTIPNGMAALMTDPDSILSVWDESFDAVNLALGRPLERFRGEYLIVDRQGHVKFTAAPAAYPMSLEVYNFSYEDTWQAPVDVESGREWYNGPVSTAFHYIIMHEYGHLHNMPTLIFEQETNVHLPAAAAYSIAMGESIDSAFVYSMDQRLTFEEATLDWILTPRFYNGYRIGWDTVRNVQDWDQMLYQSRAFVKYVDIVKMFGWEAYGDINNYFYQYQIDNPDWDPYGLGDDEFIRAASEVLGVNMAPHFEFHGILPSDALVEELKLMDLSETVKDRILYYRSIVPVNNDELQIWYDAVIDKLSDEFHDPRWNEYQANYNETTANKIVARIDTILAKYYDLSIEDRNTEPTINGLSTPLSVNENESITLALADFEVSDRDHNYPNDHTLTVLDGDNYTFDGLTVSPDQDFSEVLYVHLKVNDGIEDSEVFSAEIDVISIEELNFEPVITGLATPLSILENTSITLSLSDLVVEDQDHKYPMEHTLTISDGDNYTVDGLTITPSLDYSGTLIVLVAVSDGIEDSETFNVEIEVEAILGTERLEELDFYPNPTSDGTITFSGE